MTIRKKHDDVNLFLRYLGEDESILWIGQPNPRWLVSPQDVIMIPFSLMWGGFAIFWEVGVLSSGGGALFALWGIPFVIVGQYFIWGRFLHKYLRRQKTYYAITDRRVLILNKLFGSDLKTYFLHKLSALQRQGQAVLFELDEARSIWRWRHRGWQSWTGEDQPGFYALPDADDVYRLLQDIIWQQPKSKNDWR